MKNVLTTDPIKVKEGKPRGIRAALTLGSKMLGIYGFLEGLGFAGGKGGQIDKFPNLLNIINPIKYGSLMFKSFFPPSSEGTGESGSSANLGEKEVDAGGDAVAQDDPTQEGGESRVQQRCQVRVRVCVRVYVLVRA